MAKNVIEFTIRGIDKFSSTMRKFGAAIAKVGKTMVNAAKWVAATATAIVAFTAVTLNGVDATAKFSTRIGIAVEELSKMQFVASQAGITTEQFNMSVQRMTRRVSEAAVGLGEAKPALAELGISAKEFNRIGLEDQMALLAERFEEVKNPADKLRLAFKLFDSEGTSMLQMLKGGSKEMRALAADSEFLGLVISKQAAANAEHFADSMGRATGSMKGVSRAISNELGPLLAGLANRFANALAGSRGSIVNFVKGATTNLFVLFEVFNQITTHIRKVFTDKAAFSQFLDNFGSLIVAVVKMAGHMMVMFAKVIWEGIKVLFKLFNAFGTWLGSSMANWVAGKPAQDFSDALTDAVFNAMKEAGENLEQGLKGPVEAFNRAGSEAGAAFTSSFGINMETARTNAEAVIQNLMEFGVVAEESVGGVAGRVSTVMEEASIAYNDWLMTLQEANKTFAENFFTTMTGTIDAISAGMAKVLVDGESFSQTMKNIGKQVLSSLVAMLVKLGIQRLVFSALNLSANATEAGAEASRAVAGAGANAVMSMAAAPFPLNLSAPAFGAAMASTAAAQYAAGAALGKTVAVAGARQEGGPVMGGRTYLVGERGPELFTPNTAGNITSNDNLGGGVVIENIELHVLENVTEGGEFLSMSKTELNELVAGPLLDAMNAMDKLGIRPAYAERKR